MLTIAAFATKDGAVDRAREEQRGAASGILFSVEYDRTKRHPFRVRQFDLNTEWDREIIAPKGWQRVEGVTVIMHARSVIKLTEAASRRLKRSRELGYVPPVSEGDERLAAALAARKVALG